MKTEAAAIATNLAMTYAVLGSLKGQECNLSDAVCALLTAATVLIEEGYTAGHRLEVLNQFLAPTIADWAQQSGKIEVTLQ